MTYRLFNYFRSSASQRIRIALYHKNIPFEYVSVHLVHGGGEQKKDEYVARNPMAQVPTLEVVENGVTSWLSQSIAVLEYLEEKHPEPAMLPEDAILRARVRELSELVNAGIQPHQNLTPIARIDALSPGAGRAHAKLHNEIGLAALEKRVLETAGKFCVGDQLTFADACLIPQLAAARRFEVDVRAYPTLLAIEAYCETLPAFQKAAPAAQPDAS